MSDKTTLLRMKGSKESQPFENAHAKRLLAYPNTQWEEVADKEPAAPKAIATAADKSKTPDAA
jgi:hypothetical protein